MTTVADVARWLEDFAPSRLAEAWDNVGLLWGDPDAEVTRVMTCLTVTPDRPRGDRRAGRADRQPSSRPVPGGQASPGRPARDRDALEPGPRGGRDRQPAHGVRQHRGRDQRRPRPPARPGRRGAAPALPAPRRRSRSSSSRPRRTARRSSRRRSRPGRGGSGPTTSARSRSRGTGPSSAPRGPTRPSARPAGARPSASCGSRSSARPTGSPRSWPRSVGALVRGAGHRRLPAPPDRPGGPGVGRLGRLPRRPSRCESSPQSVAAGAGRRRAPGRGRAGAARSSGWRSSAGPATTSSATPPRPAPTSC